MIAAFVAALQLNGAGVRNLVFDQTGGRIKNSRSDFVLPILR